MNLDTAVAITIIVNIAEHSVKGNHGFKWDDEQNRFAETDRKSDKHLMNGDEGAHTISHLYDSFDPKVVIIR